MSDQLIYQKGDIIREVHPDAKSTQRLLKKAGFIEVKQEQPETACTEPVEVAVSPNPELVEGDDPFAFLPKKAAKALVEAGIHSLEQLAETDAETLLAIDGIGETTLEKILEATADLS